MSEVNCPVAVPAATHGDDHSYDTVEIRRPPLETVRFGGMQARLLTEVALAGTAHWSALANELWRDAPDPAIQRPRWDQVLKRLRGLLREHGIRDDLVASEGAGQVSLRLLPGDRLIDEA